MINKESKVAAARELFLQGYNCAQAVAGAFAEEMRMKSKEVLLLVSGLGGGVGGQRLTCGAVTGMTVVAGKLLGYDESDMLPEKKALYALIQNMGASFADEFGSQNCRELLSANQAHFSSIPSERTPEYYRTRPCARYVEAAAGILTDTLNQELNF